MYIYIIHYSHWSAQASFTLVCRDNSHLKQCFDSSQIIYCFNQRSHPYQGDVAQKNTMDPSRTTILFQESAACIQNRICSSNVSVFYMTKKCAARSSNSRKWEELPTSKVWFWKDILFWSNITLCMYSENDVPVWRTYFICLHTQWVIHWIGIQKHILWKGHCMSNRVDVWHRT